MTIMKKVILTPNPYRDKNFATVKEAMDILQDAGMEVKICLPFDVDRTYDLPRDLHFSRLDKEIQKPPREGRWTGMEDGQSQSRVM